MRLQTGKGAADPWGCHPIGRGIPALALYQIWFLIFWKLFLLLSVAFSFSTIFVSHFTMKIKIVVISLWKYTNHFPY